MNLQKIGLLFLVLITSLSISFGQGKPETVEGETWVQPYMYYPTQTMIFRYDRYSKEDTVKFREKLDLLKEAKFVDEWEGIYYRGIGDEVGISSFRFDSNIGFVHFYIYTCFPELRYINYGKISNMPDSIIITPEFAMDSPRKESIVKYVKIKWNDRNYLVNEKSLSAFAEKIAGIYVDADYEFDENSDEDYPKWSGYWVKGDTEKELTGLPIFPSNYKSFQRFPIETKIISVGKRTFEAEKEIGEKSYAQYYSDSAFYPITIGAGKTKGVKVGMYFKVPDTNDEIYITEVNINTALGFIVRRTDENKDDECYKDEYHENKMTCARIKPALKARTKIGKF